MAKTKISEFSTTAGNNTDINSINIAEGCAPSGINDAIRELMRQLKEFQTGGAGDSVNSGGDFSVATNKFTVASATGNTAVAGTLGATGDFAVNTDKFTVTASSGNTSVAGTLASTGNFAVNTDKFTVAASTGNTAVGGTFAVTGATTLTGALVANGNSTLGDADTDTVTLNASFVNGTTLKTAKTATNTLALAAYDVDGTAYTNLVTLTAGNTPSLALTSTAVGTINNMSIGATTASTGAFTTLSASGNVTLSGGTANGVLYLNGSKVATSGSALKFDGTDLMLGANSFVIKNAIADGNGFRIYQDASDVSTLMNYYNGSMVFGIGNSEKMRLTSTGLGIGTSSPATKLEVRGAGATVAGISGIVGGVFENSASATTAPQGAITLGAAYTGTTPTVYAYLAGAKENTTDGNYAGALIFGSRPNGGNLTKRARIDSSGNLGIGTSSPAARLVSAGSSATNFKALILRNGDGTTGSSASIDFEASTGTSGDEAAMAGRIAGLRTGTGTSGALTFSTTNSGTLAERARIDSSGNLGVGTTSTSSRFEAVAGTGAQDIARFRTGDATAANNAGGGFYANSSATAGSRYAYMWLDADGANFSGLDYFSIYKSGNSGGVEITNSSNSYMTFGTNNTERARIDSSGNLLVGDTTSGTARLRVTNSASDDIAVFKSSNTTPYGVNSVFSAASPNNTTSYFYNAVDSGPTTRFKVYSNGGIANYSANNANLSDQRVKTNIQDAGGYLAKICAIPVRTFKYKDQTDDLPNLGVIAQEVESVAPELVDTTGFGETPDDGVPLKAIYQTDLQYALMKCIQEQQAQIESLRKRLADAGIA